ncbi:MAG: phasin family protein [Janthinobacterium lividum]
MATAPLKKAVALKKTALKKDVTPLVRKAQAVKTDTVVEVRSYARKIWLAGLGAYAKAGKEGLDYVKELIKAGEGVEKDGKKVIDKELKAANSQIDVAKDEVAEVKGKVEVQLDKLEKLFDVRVASALNRIGIPSRHDVDTLSAKLDKLTALVERAARKP